MRGGFGTVDQRKFFYDQEQLGNENENRALAWSEKFLTEMSSKVITFQYHFELGIGIRSSLELII